MNQLDQLKQFTTVVADTGNFKQLGAVRAARRDHQPVADPEGRAAARIRAAAAPRRSRRTDERAARRDRRRGAGALRPRDPEDRAGPRLDRGRCAPVFDTARHASRARSASIALYERAGIGRERVLIKVASTWEGIQAAQGARARGHPLQPDAAVLVLPGGGLRRGRRHADLAVRRPHLRLVQEGGRRSLGRGRERRRQRPRRAVGDADLQLLQALRHRHRSDGRELSQHRADPRAGRLRPADDQPRAAGAAAGERGAGAARARPERRQGAPMHARHATTRPASAMR